jgi:YcxB-like protein
VIVALAVFIALGLLLFPYLRLRSAVRKAPGFKKRARYIFDAQGIRFESEDAKGEYKWSAFATVLETRRAFALAQTDYAATYVPKRCFASPNDIAIFRQLMRDNFKGRWRLRRK